jgi:F-type H+-transporting ATPase subunit b
MEIISNVALISINETLIAQLVSFLIFLYIINRIMFKPLLSVVNERNDHIDKMHREISGAEEELDNVKRMLSENEAAVKEEAFSIKAKLESAGDLKSAEIYREAKNQIEAMRESANADVKAQLDEAKKSIHKESEILVYQIMEKVLERRLA